MRSVFRILLNYNRQAAGAQDAGSDLSQRTGTGVPPQRNFASFAGMVYTIRSPRNMGRTMQKMIRKISNIGRPLPRLGRGLPQMGKGTPQLIETAPRSGNPAPLLRQTAPRLGDALHDVAAHSHVCWESPPGLPLPRPRPAGGPSFITPIHANTKEHITCHDNPLQNVWRSGVC